MNGDEIAASTSVMAAVSRAWWWSFWRKLQFKLFQSPFVEQRHKKNRSQSGTSHSLRVSTRGSVKARPSKSFREIRGVPRWRGETPRIIEISLLHI